MYHTCLKGWGSKGLATSGLGAAKLGLGVIATVPVQAHSMPRWCDAGCAPCCTWARAA